MLCAALACAVLSFLLSTEVVADGIGGSDPMRVRYDPIRVHHPKVECGSDQLEVEVYDRATETWIPHPEHPRRRSSPTRSAPERWNRRRCFLNGQCNHFQQWQSC